MAEHKTEIVVDFLTATGGVLASCTCTWQGPIRDKRSEAEQDAAEHKQSPTVNAAAPTTVHPDQQLADDTAAGLRALADWIQANPEVVANFSRRLRISAYPRSSDVAAEFAQLGRLARKHGATVKKDVSEQMYNLALNFGAVTVQVLAYRQEVCERVVVGTREVTEEVPDPEALAAVPTTTVTRTEDVVEWQCKPLLAAGES